MIHGMTKAAAELAPTENGPARVKIASEIAC